MMSLALSPETATARTAGQPPERGEAAAPDGAAIRAEAAAEGAPDPLWP